MKFADQDPNLRESDAHEVPSPHSATSRALRVALTMRRIASRRLSRLMQPASAPQRRLVVDLPGRQRGCGHAVGHPLDPYVGPQPVQTQQQPLCTTAGSVTVREATEVKAAV
ncbi:hypothetical protein [Nonomuraea jabiensis]|uniref:hypothetical protein n=1 Tax=Nonomuraea jabiensis TaxID=882448 RepID=UPI003691C90B